MREAERFFILQQIDTFGKHLQAMDALRESVGLVAMGKDPDRIQERGLCSLR